MPETAFLEKEKSSRMYKTKSHEKILEIREVRAICNLRKSDSKIKDIEGFTGRTFFICLSHRYQVKFRFRLWSSIACNSASFEPILTFLDVLESSGLSLFDFFIVETCSRHT